jgi:hypothetical protein
MALFDSILQKLGLKKAAEPAKPAATFSAPTASATAQAAAAAAAAASKSIPVVDVVSKLENLAKKQPMKLNWKESIVDLLVLLDLPHTGNDLKELAVELKCPQDIIDDSFKRNMWLHKTVLKKLAANGGNIPKELLD